MTTIREREIRQLAREVLHEMSITSLAVDPVRIATEKGILVQAMDVKSGISGVLMHLNDNFTIGYSTSISNEGFRNFTVAHELGHYHIDGHTQDLLANGTHFSASGFMSNDEHEREADTFASELLMPAEFMAGELRKCAHGFPTIQHLSTVCKTSILASAWRYVELAELPLAIIVSKGTEILYSKVSASLKRLPNVKWFIKDQRIVHPSATFQFNSNPSNISHGNTSESSCLLSDYFSTAPDMDMNEDIIGLGHYGGTLTVLFNDEIVLDDENETFD